ncbi:MAG: O-antigen ligase family protein [Bacteroidales bacterium]|nr:O-antigen ligase family protein [Bacteroidales bacterium]
MNQTLEHIAQSLTASKQPRKKLLSDNWHFNVFFFLLLAAAATLPFSTWIMLPIAGIQLVNWIWEWNWKEKWNTLRENASPLTIFVLLSMYLLVIYGFFLSYNKSRAMAAFDCYLWFLVAPLFLLTQKRRNLTNSRIHMIFMFFAISTVLHLCIIFFIAIRKYIQTGNDAFLYYQNFSVFRHPSYLAMYATFSFYVMLDYLNKTHKSLPLYSKIGLYIAMAVLLAGVFFLQSKAGILVFCILAVVWFVYLLFIRSTNIAAALSVVIVVTSIGIVLHETQILSVHRIKDSIEEVGKYTPEHLGSSSNQIRITVWKSTLEICKKNLPWGVGTGDATDELNVNAVKKNYTNLIGHHYNAHNQYLQTLLTTGIPGIIILLTYCLYPLVISIRKRNILYQSFVLILILNILVESMFEVRAGVDFLAMMNVLLFLRSK